MENNTVFLSLQQTPFFLMKLTRFGEKAIWKSRYGHLAINIDVGFGMQI